MYSNAGISNVRVLGYPAGRFSDGRMAALPGVMSVSWHSSRVEDGELFQVYVDGRWAGVTLHPQQRELVVEYEPGHTAAVEVVAVAAGQVYKDYADQLEGLSAVSGSYAVIQWPQCGSIPLGSEVRIYSNNADGEIDYENSCAVVPVWDNMYQHWGWGLAGFGEDDFGYSATAAPGWGVGGFGAGEFGFDAEMQSWRSELSGLGVYKYAVRIYDSRGNMIYELPEEIKVVSDPLPAAARLTIASYEPQTNELILEVCI